MAHDDPAPWPALKDWADVDPARHAFDPVDVPDLIESVAPPTDRAAVHAWQDGVSVVLSDRYGPWAFRWYWAPYERPYGSWWDRDLPLAEVPALAAEGLLAWRGWLETVAERFDRWLPLLDATYAGPGDGVEAWESALAELMRMAVAPVADDDSWQGNWRMVLVWFLTAAGVPVGRAEAMVDDATPDHFDGWVPLTATDVVDVAERLTREALGSVEAVAGGEWPDTWPHGWPAWRATNTTGHPRGRLTA